MCLAISSSGLNRSSPATTSPADLTGTSATTRWSPSPSGESRRASGTRQLDSEHGYIRAAATPTRTSNGSATARPTDNGSIAPRRPPARTAMPASPGASSPAAWSTARETYRSAKSANPCRRGRPNPSFHRNFQFGLLGKYCIWTYQTPAKLTVQTRRFRPSTAVPASADANHARRRSPGRFPP